MKKMRWEFVKNKIKIKTYALFLHFFTLENEKVIDEAGWCMGYLGASLLNVVNQMWQQIVNKWFRTQGK